MSLILSKQSGRRSAVLTKLPNPKAGRNYSLTAVFDWKYYTRPGPLRQVKDLQSMGEHRGGGHLFDKIFASWLAFSPGI